MTFPISRRLGSILPWNTCRQLTQRLHHGPAGFTLLIHQRVIDIGIDPFSGPGFAGSPSEQSGKYWRTGAAPDGCPGYGASSIVISTSA
jgi:hypothetical protein